MHACSSSKTLECNSCIDRLSKATSYSLVNNFDDLIGFYFRITALCEADHDL